MTEKMKIDNPKNRLLVALTASFFLLVMAVPSFAGQIVVNSLPYTIRASDHSSDAVDTVTLAGTRLSSSGDGLTIVSEYQNPAEGFYVNLGSDTISFGEGGGNGARGLEINRSGGYMPQNISVVGGHIIHNTPNPDADACIGIFIVGHDILIKDVNCIIRGNNGKCVATSGSPGHYNIEIDGGHYRSDVTGYTSRCNYDAAVMFLSNSYAEAITDSGGVYHYKIHDVVIENGPHVGIYLGGRESTENWCVSQVYGCTITTDAVNDFYPSYSGTCYSSSNPYGISLRRVGPGTDIHDNTITSGTARGGNRGILVEYASGTAQNPISIHHNYIDVHEGPNVEYGDNLPVHGLRIRYNPNYLHVYDNVFICTGDHDPATADYGMNVHTFRYSASNGNSHNLFERNVFRAVALESGVNTNAITWDEVNVSDPTMLSRYNRVESNGVLVHFGDVNGGAKSIRMAGDTLRFLSPSYNPRTWHVGYLGNNWDCSDNKACDIVYQNGASDGDIEFANNGILDLSLKRLLHVTVMGNNDEPVAGAAVSVVNNYGQTVVSGTTDGAGLCTGEVTYRWESMNYQDSTSFNDFVIKAKAGSDSTVVTHNVSASSQDPILILDDTSGEEVIDTIPPAPIEDLDASAGSNPGEVHIGWTAPGDDDDAGTAESYEIRYGKDPITEAGWTGATLLGSPPSPLESGTFQTMVIPGLDEGELYYVGMKARDEENNVSQLSNISSAVAAWSMVLDTGDGELVPISPLSGSVLGTSRPVLKVNDFSENTSDAYLFEVSRDSVFMNLTASSPAVYRQEGGLVSWKVEPRLMPDVLHYWRVQSESSGYSPVNSFSVKPVPYVYPNPFHYPAVTEVTFTDLPTGGSLYLMSVDGQEVRRWDDLTGEDIVWDGTNSSGNAVASDAYLWFVEEGNSSGKIIVIR